jgi:hypothetical protein
LPDTGQPEGVWLPAGRAGLRFPSPGAQQRRWLGSPAPMPAKVGPLSTAVVFDGCGSVFHVHGAVTRHAARLGPAAAMVSTMWWQRVTAVCTPYFFA